MFIVCFWWTDLITAESSPVSARASANSLATKRALWNSLFVSCGNWRLMNAPVFRLRICAPWHCECVALNLRCLIMPSLKVFPKSIAAALLERCTQQRTMGLSSLSHRIIRGRIVKVLIILLPIIKRACCRRYLDWTTDWFIASAVLFIQQWMHHLHQDGLWNQLGDTLEFHSLMLWIQQQLKH